MTSIHQALPRFEYRTSGDIGGSLCCACLQLIQEEKESRTLEGGKPHTGGGQYSREETGTELPTTTLVLGIT